MRKGFTLIELLIVIGITVILVGGSVLYLGGFKTRQSLNLSTSSLVAFLRDAQSKAITQEDGLQWGVRLDKPVSGRDAYYLFNGPSYSVPISVVALPGGVEFDPASGPFPKDVIFQKSTGRPVAAASVILRLTGNSSATKTITVNAQGAISEQ